MIATDTDRDDGAQQTVPQAQGGAMTRVETSREGQQVWAPVRDLWLANAVMSQHGTSQSAGYRWEANRYVPVLSVDQDETARLFFAKAPAEA